MTQYRRKAGHPVDVWRVGDGEPPEWAASAIRQFLKAFPGVTPRGWASAMEGGVVFRRDDGRLETLTVEALERDYEPLPAPSDDAREALEIAREALERIHNALMDPRAPRQAVGEMVAAALTRIGGGG